MIHDLLASFLFPEDSYFLRAGVGSQSSSFDPSIDLSRRLSIVVLFNRFHKGVFICFIAEKTLSISALAAGRTII